MPQTDNLQQQFASFFPTEQLKQLAGELWNALSKGSICIPTTEEAYDQATQKWISNDVSSPKPIIRDGNKLYFFRYHRYQEVILNKIEALIQSSREKFEERAASLLRNPGLEHLRQSMDHDREVDWQTIAALMAYLNDFMIITGGPGTGKTSTLAKVLSLLYSENPELIIKMAAPTGKAANRMEQALKNNHMLPDELLEKVQTLKATTIHRLLGSIKLSPYFRHRRENPIAAEVVIIDEASMVDVALFAKLMDAIGPNTRLLLLGDQNQLASVEAGSLFGDICSSVTEQNHLGAELIELLQRLLRAARPQNISSAQNAAFMRNHLIALQHSYRFDETQKIAMISKAVIQGNQDAVLQLLKDGTTPEQLIFDPEHDSAVFEQFIAHYEDFIHEDDTKKALLKLDSMRVLAAVRMGKRGIYELNKQIEKYLAGKKLIKPNAEFYENRPLIVTKNYYELQLFNGDIGLVRDNKAWFMDETGELRHVSPGLIAEVETAFAMTIHKSQGSEFDKVLLVLPVNAGNELLTRELLYTGITRAKSSVILQSSNEVVLAAVSKTVNRASGLQEKIIAKQQN